MRSGGGQTVAITGRAFLENGRALPSATILILGQGSTTTDTEGRFEVAEVSVPYDIAVLSTDWGDPVVTVYQGVTRADPRVVAFSDDRQSSSSSLEATVVGDRLSARDASQEVFRTFIYASPDRLTVADRTSGSWSGSDISAKYEWPTTEPATGTFHVLESLVDVETGRPAEFAYGRAEGVQVEDGARRTFEVRLGRVESERLDVSCALPAGFQLKSAVVMLDVGDLQRLDFDEYEPEDQASGGNRFSTIVPKISGMSLSLYALAQGADGNVVAFSPVEGDLANVELRLPSTAPNLGRPLEGAVGLDLATTEFSWAPLSRGSVSVLRMGAEDPDLKLFVVTAADRARLPAFEELGLGAVPSGLKVGWSVSGFGAVGSVDEALDPSHPAVQQFGAHGYIASGASFPRRFTTK